MNKIKNIIYKLILIAVILFLSNEIRNNSIKLKNIELKCVQLEEEIKETRKENLRYLDTCLDILENETWK